MHRLRRRLVLLALAAACAACGQTPPPADPARRASGPEPAQRPAPVAQAPARPGSDAGTRGTIRYACDDGSAVGIAYAGDEARVTLPDGRVVALPKAQSASRGGGEVFVGEAVSLQRDGDGIQLFQDEGKALHCRAGAAPG